MGFVKRGKYYRKQSISLNIFGQTSVLLQPEAWNKVMNFSPVV